MHLSVSLSLVLALAALAAILKEPCLVEASGQQVTAAGNPAQELCCYSVFFATNDCKPWLVKTKTYHLYPKSGLAPLGNDAFQHVCCTAKFATLAKPNRCKPSETDPQFSSWFVGGMDL